MTKSGTLFSSNRMQKCNIPSSGVKSIGSYLVGNFI